MFLFFCAFSLSHLRFGDHFCGLSALHHHVEWPEPTLNSSSAATLARDSWEPIRVVLDISSFTSGKDSHACRSVGQRVEWGYFRGVCTADSVLSESRLSVLNATLRNVESYLSRMLRVARETQPISVTRVSDIPLGGMSFDADLVMGVAIRPFAADDKILGMAFPHRTIRSGRAVVGGMYLNPEYAPVEPQSEHSFDRFFFTVVFHELVHVLALASGSWTRWVDRETGRPYAGPIETTVANDTYGTKKFRILHTPAIHRCLAERFGSPEFAPGVPMGLEIEDGGGSGTAGAHPEARVYGAEVMCGVFVGYVFISCVSLAILDDTGWYEVNYSIAEPYPWGDGRSMGVAPLAQFPNAPPQLAFPEHYLCWERRW
jgi:leishmanolysin